MNSVLVILMCVLLQSSVVRSTSRAFVANKHNSIGHRSLLSPLCAFSPGALPLSTTRSRLSSTSTSSSSMQSMRMSMTTKDNSAVGGKKRKGKLLVLGGTGFLGTTICQRAVVEGYDVTSVSRRGVPPTGTSVSSPHIEYRKGDVRQKETVANILGEGDDYYTGVIHCIGLLFDDESGLGSYNRFVSGSASVPDASSSYDSITRQTAFHAIDAAIAYVKKQNKNITKPFPFVFTSAAEAGWPEMTGGDFIESNLAPDWLKRYLVAKRAVERKLLQTLPEEEEQAQLLRPIIVRPSLIYSLDRPASYVPVGAFFLGNKVGLPFVDRPVTVQALSCAMVRAIDRDSVSGILRYPEIDALNE